MTLRSSDPSINALAFPLAINPASGKAQQVNDYDTYITHLIRQTLLVAPGERINRPEFGAGIRRMVFATGVDGNFAFVKALVLEALERWMGQLIKVETIEVQNQDATLLIDINYVVLQRGHRRFLNLKVTL